MKSVPPNPAILPVLTERLQPADAAMKQDRVEPVFEVQPSAYAQAVYRGPELTQPAGIPLLETPVSQGNAGPPQVSLTPTGGGSASRPWGRSQGNAGPPQVSLTPTGGGEAGRPWGHSDLEELWLRVAPELQRQVLERVESELHALAPQLAARLFDTLEPALRAALAEALK
ncbi:MAG: hypothetical protein RBR52_02960 [Thiomonas sp.]|uniref:hypothetical protein n=1 Tax=Thiomonas sp. TaxID=2047785 RepID=UPI002A361174|nr:hypothetical protein [Thiomonas sp.]MDY0329439.1 hypothetical protein [Thiomonas sp.]